jgi:hypothetical protein
MAKYISSIDLASYANIPHEEVIDMLDSEESFVSRISQEEYESLKDNFTESAQVSIDNYFGVTKQVALQFDLLGGLSEVKSKKKGKTQPPERVWENDDYLPNLEESLNYKYKFFDDLSQPLSEELIFDIEVYGNYFLIMFLGFRSGRCWYFEKTDTQELDVQGIRWFIDNHTLISFNGIKFDLPLLAVALNNARFEDLWNVTELLINDENNLRPYQILKQYKVKQLDCDHIDLIEVAPLKGSLKLYGARLHTPNLQDLPFKPGINLNDNQIAIVRRYCLNDVETTAYLYAKLIPQVELRKGVTRQFGIDVRSKSDPQVAEAIIKVEVESVEKRKIYPPKDIAIDHVTYDVPSFISFNTYEIQTVLEAIKTEKFKLYDGVIDAGCLEGSIVNIDNCKIRCGIGGLHSSEKSVSVYEDAEYMIMDADVTSYYPSIIINQGLSPDILGRTFLKVYKGAREKRVIAKRNGDKATDAMYKTLLNGSFGKFGSKYSLLFAPKLLIQVTVTGQLSLLMLAECLSKEGVEITSVNTDGATLRFLRRNEDSVKSIISQWERDTGFGMEYAYYKSTHSRDVNNYYAIKTDGKIKRKGAYGEETLSKNPQNMVCSDAVAKYLLDGTPVDEYIESCKDIRKFLTVRNVTGGAVKDGNYLGKTVRFYHSLSTHTALQYAKSGNLVPTSDNCRPLMRLPKVFPVDVDYQWYVDEAVSILKDVGVKYNLTQ